MGTLPTLAGEGDAVAFEAELPAPATAPTRLAIARGTGFEVLTQWAPGSAERRVVQAILPDDVLVLPSHGGPFHGLHARVDALIAGHRTGLKRLRRSLSEGPKRAVDVFGALFARKIDGGVLGMTTGESLAHLNHLRAVGEATATPDEAGVVWWRAA